MVRKVQPLVVRDLLPRTCLADCCATSNTHIDCTCAHDQPSLASTRPKRRMGRLFSQRPSRPTRAANKGIHQALRRTLPRGRDDDVRGWILGVICEEEGHSRPPRPMQTHSLPLPRAHTNTSLPRPTDNGRAPRLLRVRPDMLRVPSALHADLPLLSSRVLRDRQRRVVGYRGMFGFLLCSRLPSRRPTDVDVFLFALA